MNGDYQNLLSGHFSEVAFMSITSVYRIFTFINLLLKYWEVGGHRTILTNYRHSIKWCYKRKGGKGVRNKVGSLPEAGQHKPAPPGFGTVEGTWVFIFR